MNMRKKAQSTLESTLAFAAGAAIIGATMGIFAWGNAHIPIRQATYSGTRTMAGTPARTVSARGASGGNKAEVWPTYIAAPCP